MRKKSVTICLIICAAGVLHAEPQPMLPGNMWNILSSQGYKYQPGYSDEFTGGEDSYDVPDPSKWNQYHPTGWKGNDKFVYRKDMACIHKNNLVLEARPGDRFECGIVSQKWPVQYGYFEVRVKQPAE